MKKISVLLFVIFVNSSSFAMDAEDAAFVNDSFKTTLKRFGSDQCLTQLNGAKYNSVRLILAPCQELKSQQFEISYLSLGRYRIVNPTTGMCIFKDGHPNLNSGAKIFMWDCHTQANGEWLFTPYDGEKYYSIKVSDSGMCLDVHPGQTAHQIKCDSKNNNQKWVISETD